MEAILFGLLTGLGMATATGPVFLTLIRISVDRGFAKAVFFLAGVSTVDWFIVFASWVGFNKLDFGMGETLLSLLAGAAMVLYGSTFIFSLNKKPKELGLNDQPDLSEKEQRNKKKLDNAHLYLKGVVMNALNPIVWAFWAGITQLSIAKFSYQSDQVLYFVGILMTILVTDLLKGFYAQKLKPFFTSKLLKYLNIVIGVMLIGLGGRFLVKYFIEVKLLGF
ncbi:LysE family transporter [Reichenbachiella sp. MALMAid0571]|uniref:LysE family translocator n=1 Tax=Reichenbachiella sp. MALMAid0571 TaxID=3143939 RepID=UPI0032E02C63